MVLRGAVLPYAWGGRDFIPALIGVENTEARPFAELWVGAHPKAPAVAKLGGVELGLDELISTAGDSVLGPDSRTRFPDGLPYLLKVLDVRGMLSIQAHPTKRQAEEGFEREASRGVPLDAPERNYRDRNHKPEAHVAVTDFHMLHGFRPLDELSAALDEVPELSGLDPGFGARLRRVGGDAAAQARVVQPLYERAMTLPQDEVDAILAPLLQRLLPSYRSGELERDDPCFWAARAMEELPLAGGHCDRGIFSLFLLNLVHLRPGEGTYQPAGVLHAYLEGVTVEIMANSDNVLRGGLTSKHVDVPELLRRLCFVPGRPAVLAGASVSPTERVYETPALEFMLSRLDLSSDRDHRRSVCRGAESLIVLEGEGLLDHQTGSLPWRRGSIVLVPAGQAYTLQASSPAVLFRASVPGAD